MSEQTEIELTEEQKAEEERVWSLLTPKTLNLIVDALRLYETVHNIQNSFQQRDLTAAALNARGDGFDGYKAAHERQMSHRQQHLTLEHDCWEAEVRIKNAFRLQQASEALRSPVTTGQDNSTS